MNFTAIDFETTGFAGGAENEPWQLGLARVEKGKIVAMQEFFFCSPQTPSAPEWMEQWPLVHAQLVGQRLVAHNLSTERTILTRYAPLTHWGPWTDTLRLARLRYPKLPSYALGDLCVQLGCVPQLAGRSWHDGLYDAVACAELALRLLLPSVAL